MSLNKEYVWLSECRSATDNVCLKGSNMKGENVG